MRVQRVSKSGHAFVVVLPRAMMRALKLHHRDYVVVSLEDQAIRVEKLEHRQRRAGVRGAVPSSA